MSQEFKNEYQPPKSKEDLLKRFAHGERQFPQTDIEDTLDLTGTFLEEISFSPGSFLVADFRNANLQGANFTDCNVKTCDFRGANLQNAKFKNAALEGTEFLGANLEETDFTGASCFDKVFEAGEKPDW